MCGVVGYWAQKTSDAGHLKRALPNAVRSMAHRGPDGEGLWWSSSAEVGFGHRRLAVIDLSAAGAQPMVARDAECVLIFNGEVYNFAEIAADLTARGRKLSSHSDTEVVLESFREWGHACVDRFVGMFAFAIWDGTQRRLSLCRDRAGVKPLYWAWDRGVLSFASELKALRALLPNKPDIDMTALGEMLQYGYISQPRTIYRTINKLPPGCWLTIDDSGEPKVAPYWSLREAVEKGPLTGSSQQLEEELESLLAKAAKLRLVADVPVGLFLSGGVDSSLVAGMLKSQGVDIETFTIGFTSRDHDESGAAAGVARALGYKNHSLIIDMAEAGPILDMWPDLYDEPFGDHSGIPTYLVARMAREHVTVALSADGGDELFCGYAGYNELAKRMTKHASVPSWGRAAAAKSIEAAMATGALGFDNALGSRLAQWSGGRTVMHRAQKMHAYLDASPGIDALRSFRSYWLPGEIERLTRSGYCDPRTGSLKWPGEPAEAIAAQDFHEYLPDDVLTKVDRATMAVSLESREPLLDHRVIEMAFRLPLHMRINAEGGKRVLRNILYRHVPRALVDRPKQGFAVPINNWVQQLVSSGAVSESADCLVNKLGFDKRAIDSALKAFSSDATGRTRLWLLYVLGRWAARWL